MFLLKTFKKRKAVKSYISELPLAIKRRYGEKAYYTEKEVTDCVKSSGLILAHIDYAWAIYLESKEYEGLKKKNWYLGDYETLREEVAHRFFDGHADDLLKDVFLTADPPMEERTGTYG